MGFTPINGPVTLRAEAGDHLGRGVIRDEDAKSTNAAVSDYLGRGRTESKVTPVSQALHGPGAKKATSKGKKRASTGSGLTKYKRRKNSVADSSVVSKSQEVEEPPGKPVTKPSKPRTKSKLAAEKKKDDSSVHDVPADEEKMRFVPVFGHKTSMNSTSMDAVRSTRPATSMDVVKSAQTNERTLHNSGKLDRAKHTGAGLAEPSINQAAAHSMISNTRRRRPSAAQFSSSLPAEADDEFDFLLAEVGDQVTTTASTSTSDTGLSVLSSLGPTSHGFHKHPSRRMKVAPPIQTEEDLLELGDSEDEALADIAEATEDSNRNHTTPPRTAKQNVKEVSEHDDYNGALLTEAEKQLLQELQASKKADTDMNKRIVRKPPPMPILDRSPVFGATNATVLRTCFRIGEALNVGCQAVRVNKPVLLELYARVTSSYREVDGLSPKKQHFVLHDLYHDKLPFIHGVFELWSQSRLWELDSRGFLDAKGREGGKMCRVVGRMKWCGEGRQWTMSVLQIWEASWEDVNVVAGIYAKDAEEILAAAEDGK